MRERRPTRTEAVDAGVRAVPLISAVVTCRNRPEKLAACLTSIEKWAYGRVEVIVVDDDSDVDLRTRLAPRFPRVTFMRNPRRMYLAASRNAGAQMAKGEYIFFIDDDNVVDPQAPSKLLAAAGQSRRIAVVSPVAFYLSRPREIWTYSIRPLAPGLLQKTVGRWRGLETASFHNAFMVRREVFQRMGGFDGGLKIGFTELDLAGRLLGAGYRLLVVPDAFTWHDGSQSGLLSSMKPNPDVLYHSFRNRVLIARRYSGFAGRILCYTVCIPLLVAFYAILTARLNPSRLRDSLGSVVKGVMQGLRLDASIAPPEAPRFPMESPLVTVAVPTKNSSSTLAACLNSLAKQTYANMEVVVVDNGSTDDTVTIAKSYDAHVIAGGTERSAQLNLAIRASSGKYVYRVDSDFVVSPTVIGEAVFACESLGYDGVLVHNTSDPGASVWARVRKLERDCYVDDSINVAARFISKLWLEKIGGFDENLIASEDYDLHNRLLAAGASIGRIRSGEAHIGEPRSLREVVEKHLFYGRLLHGFVSHYRGFSYRQLGPARAAYLRHWRYFLRDPLATMLFPFYQFVRYASAIIGFMAN